VRVGIDRVPAVGGWIATFEQNARSQPPELPVPTIHVEMFEGRTVEQKAALAKEFTEACVRVLGGKADSVDVIFRDVARHDWATGGRLWSEAQAAKPA
jgi:4-oxalocrotonate tautomerase